MKAARAAALLCGLAALAACSGEELDPALRVGFTGSGHLALVWALEDANAAVETRLAVYTRGGARRVPIEGVDEARWLGPAELLATRRAGEGVRELGRIRAGDGSFRRLATPGAWFEPEPSPDGALFSVGVEIDAYGEAELQIRSLEDEQLARRAGGLDQARWRPDGRGLVFASVVGNPLEGEGPSFGSVSVPFPRLFALPRDLVGAPRRLHDGPSGGPAAAGGSTPLWWDESAIWARQREGLLRCEPDGSGCSLFWASASRSLLLEGCPFGNGAALLLVHESETAQSRDANQIWRVDLASGNAEILHRTAAAVSILDLDWIPD